MIRKIEDYVIDVLLQKFLYYIQLSPTKASYIGWSLAFCFSLLEIILFKKWSLILFAIICVFEMWQINGKNTNTINLSFMRYSPSLFFLRWVVVLFLILNIIYFAFSTTFSDFDILLVNFFWAFSIFVVLCQRPSKKQKYKSKVKVYS